MCPDMLEKPTSSRVFPAVRRHLIVKHKELAESLLKKIKSCILMIKNCNHPLEKPNARARVFFWGGGVSASPSIKYLLHKQTCPFASQIFCCMGCGAALRQGLHMHVMVLECLSNSLCGNLQTHLTKAQTTVT